MYRNIAVILWHYQKQFLASPTNSVKKLCTWRLIENSHSKVDFQFSEKGVGDYQMEPGAGEGSSTDDYESLISTTDAELLKRAWRNEKAAPEILKFEAALVQRSRQQIQLMVNVYKLCNCINYLFETLIVMLTHFTFIPFFLVSTSSGGRIGANRSLHFCPSCPWNCSIKCVNEKNNLMGFHISVWVRECVVWGWGWGWGLGYRLIFKRMATLGFRRHERQLVEGIHQWFYLTIFFWKVISFI